MKPSEASVIESGPLKETPAVVKGKIIESTVPSKHTVLYQIYRERSEHAVEVNLAQQEDLMSEEYAERTEYSYGNRIRERVSGFRILRHCLTGLSRKSSWPHHRDAEMVIFTLKHVGRHIFKNFKPVVDSQLYTKAVLSNLLTA
ncbi:unnamed protein product [Brugia timori]|uniref:Uncharacterized protein n=1 Tax=Brugia timori TaxID=42155 RepID=A0A0R3QE95_9BILA|nr:unnamed protein product [Brugia timori]